MRDALTRKLEGYGSLSERDRAALGHLTPKARRVGARVDLIRENETPGSALLILEGFACRYKVLPNGRRHIVALLVPGDLCDLNVFILGQMDHNIGTISTCEVVEIPREAIDRLTASHPSIARAFWCCTLVDGAVLREWLVNLGARPANQRIAHIICEMLVRLDAVGKVADDSLAFPLTYSDIADAMGMSDVHVYRIMKELRDLNLIQTQGRILTISDVAELKSYCHFDQNYLHLKHSRGNDTRLTHELDPRGRH